jgi:two-component system, LytTR family, response regulator
MTTLTPPARRDAFAPTRRAPVTAMLVARDSAVRQNLRAFLEADAEISVVGEHSEGHGAIDAIRGLEPQLLVIDAVMEGIDWFQIVERAGRERVQALIFVSPGKEPAARAFNVGATDFILLSDGPARVRMALERAKGEIRRREAGPEEPAGTYTDGGGGAPSPGEIGPGGRILLKTSGEYLFLSPDEIRWIQADGDYVKFHVQGRSHMLRETMTNLEAKLDPGRFVRIHRSVIVNIGSVSKLSPTFSGEYAVHLLDGTRLRMSRRYHVRLLGLMNRAI